MKFPDDRMTITQVIPHLWQGAMPMPDSDMAEYGVGVRVYLLRAEVPALGFVGATTLHAPLFDNANDPATDPPTIHGVSWDRMHEFAEEAAQRVRDGRPCVALCQWGYNRSGLLVGLTMAKLGYKFSHILATMRASRGPHPEGYGPALNNHNFRAYVESVST